MVDATGDPLYTYVIGSSASGAEVFESCRYERMGRAETAVSIGDRTRVAKSIRVQGSRAESNCRLRDLVLLKGPYGAEEWIAHGGELADEIAYYDSPELLGLPVGLVPATVSQAGSRATRRFLEFFTASIRNPNTRAAYYLAVRDFFGWCEDRDVPLESVCPMVVAAYVEELGLRSAPPTVQQHLAAIRTLFDFLVIGQIVPFNPAASVRGPRHVVKKGKTPVLSSEDARLLLDSIDTSHVVGLRDRALIGVMIYSFARVSAVVHMRVEDYYRNGKRFWLRLHEKGGKFHEVPAHHNVELYLDSYIHAAGIAGEPKTSLFRSTRGQCRRLTGRQMGRRDVLRMIKRRTQAIGMTSRVCCHTFRATGITAYLTNNGSLEIAQRIAAHESPRTTKLYDRRQDELTLDEIERIVI